MRYRLTCLLIKLRLKKPGGNPIIKTLNITPEQALNVKLRQGNWWTLTEHQRHNYPFNL